MWAGHREGGPLPVRGLSALLSTWSQAPTRPGRVSPAHCRGMEGCGTALAGHGGEGRRPSGREGCGWSDGSTPWGVTSGQVARFGPEWILSSVLDGRLHLVISAGGQLPTIPYYLEDFGKL